MKAYHVHCTAPVPSRWHSRYGALALVLGLSASGAFAFSGVAPTLSGTRAGVTAGSIVLGDALSASGTGVKASGTVNLLGPVGKSVSSGLSVTVGRQAAFSIASRALATAVPAVGVASIAYEIWKQTRMKPDNAGGVLHDPGAPLQEVQCWKVQSQANYLPLIQCASSAQLAAAHLAELVAAQPNVCATAWNDCARELWAVSSVVVNGNAFTVAYAATIQHWYRNAHVSTSYATRNHSGAMTGTAPGGCAPHADGTPGAIGWDGKCSTGSYTVPKTAQEAADLAFAATQSAAIDQVALLNEVLGFQPTGIPATTYDQELDDVPKTIQGPTTTTTNADGTVTEVATGWNFAKDPVKKNTGQWLETKTTTQKNAQGQTTGTTTTTTQPNESADPADPCTANPSRIGCQVLEEPAPETVTPTVSPIAYTPAVFAGGTCPASVGFSVFGQSHAFQFAPLCDAASTWVRGVVLIVGASLAAFVFVGGLKS